MRPAILAATLLLTTAAHAQWDLEDSHTTASLRGIHNVGGGVAWASGTNGTVLRTEDGGYLWQTCAIPPDAEKLDFRGIQAFDENTAVVMSSGKGDLSRLYKTTDGCKSWKLVFTNPDKEGFWDAFQFAPEKVQGVRIGVLLGDPVGGHFPFFLSFDGGDQWERQIRQSPAILEREAIFAASNTSLVLPPQSMFYSTREFVTGGPGGARVMSLSVGRDDTCPAEDLKVMPGARRVAWSCGIWHEEKLPAQTAGESIGGFSIAVGAMGRTVVVGGDYAKPTIGSSWYQGRYLKWQPAQTPPHGYRSAVAYDPEHKLWITVGPNGTDLSTDDGKNWRPLTSLKNQPVDADKNWNALSLPFVVGPRGRIGRLNLTALPTK